MHFGVAALGAHHAVLELSELVCMYVLSPAQVSVGLYQEVSVALALQNLWRFRLGYYLRREAVLVGGAVWRRAVLDIEASIILSIQVLFVCYLILVSMNFFCSFG